MGAKDVWIVVGALLFIAVLPMLLLSRQPKPESLQQCVVRQVEIHEKGWRVLLHTEPGPSIWLDTKAQYMWPGQIVWIGLVKGTWKIVPTSAVYEGIEDATAPRPRQSADRVRSTGGTGAGE